MLYNTYPFNSYPFFRKYPNIHQHSHKHFNAEYIDNNQNNTSPSEFFKDTNVRGFDKFTFPVFELFGIKLFFDDLLIISLIFFLYNEGVEDKYLFIALILLLLS